MSFSSDAKAELCRAKIDKKCCAVAESYGAAEAVPPRLFRRL